MKTKKLYLLFGLPLIAFNVSVRGQPFVDGKAYPGALCQPETNTQSILRNIKGVMFNTGTEPQNWICPIVRAQSGNIGSAIIRVRDRNATAGGPNADVSCTLFSMTPTGTLVDSGTQGTVGDAGIVPLEYGAIKSQTGDGHYYFRCTIPGIFEGRRSGVLEYRITELSG
jgi:hypothetical protein